MLDAIPYNPAIHGETISRWLDAYCCRMTGMENWDEDVRYWSQEAGGTFYALVFTDPEPVAAAYFFLQENAVHIGEIIVNPEKRNQGIGTSVLKYILYIHSPVPKATAVIFNDNTASAAAFRKAGFVYTEEHPDGDAAYYMFHKPVIAVAEQGMFPEWMYGNETPYRFVVIFARCRNKWLYARHKERRTWETAGGHIEPGETPLEAAGRELWEETGAADFTIRYAFDYHVDNTAARPGDHAAGQVFMAEIRILGEIPESEMAEISLWDTHPPAELLTYPAILPTLFREIQNRL